MTPTNPNKKLRTVPPRKTALTYAEWAAKVDGEIEAALAEIKREGRLPAPVPPPVVRPERPSIQPAIAGFKAVAQTASILEGILRTYMELENPGARSPMTGSQIIEATRLLEEAIGFISNNVRRALGSA